MADGWRKRFMAPVSALVISLVLVLILGAVLSDPTPDPTKIRLIAGLGGSGEPPRDLPDLHVRVETAAAKSQLANVPLGPPREFTLLIPDGDIRICTKLQGWIAENTEDWTAENAEERDGGRESCWVGRPARGKDVVLMLVLREG